LKKALLFSLSLFGQIGFAVALPLVGLGLLGRYLDRQYQSSPKIFLLGILLAAILSFLYLRKIVKESIKQAKDL